MGTTRIGDRAVYEVTVRRVDDKTREQWTYPQIVTRASSVASKHDASAGG